MLTVSSQVFKKYVALAWYAARRLATVAIVVQRGKGHRPACRYHPLFVRIKEAVESSDSLLIRHPIFLAQLGENK
jgi:hypothetical protein